MTAFLAIAALTLGGLAMTAVLLRRAAHELDADTTNDDRGRL